MFDDVTWEELNLASVAKMDDIICNDLTYNDLNPDVCKNVVLGLMI